MNGARELALSREKKDPPSKQKRGRAAISRLGDERLCVPRPPALLGTMADPPATSPMKTMGAPHPKIG